MRNKTKTNTEPPQPMGRTPKQRINNNRTTTLEWTAAQVIPGLNAFYWYQIFALDSVVVVITQNCSACMEAS